MIVTSAFFFFFLSRFSNAVCSASPSGAIKTVPQHCYNLTHYICRLDHILFVAIVFVPVVIWCCCNHCSVVGPTKQMNLNVHENDGGHSTPSRAKPYDSVWKVVFSTPYGRDVNFSTFRWIIHILRIPSSEWRKEKEKKKSRHLFLLHRDTTRKKRACTRKKK